MKDKDVIKMLLKIQDKILVKNQSSSFKLPGFPIAPRAPKKARKATASQLRELAAGRKILQMKHKESQK